MTKREMMVKAHGLAKTMVGNYSARLSLALRQLWASLKKGVAVVIDKKAKINSIEIAMTYVSDNTKVAAQQTKMINALIGCGLGVSINEIEMIAYDMGYDATKKAMSY